MLIRSRDYVPPKKTLKNIEELLAFAEEKGWTEDELYYVVKLTLGMFD